LDSSQVHLSKSTFFPNFQESQINRVQALSHTDYCSSSHLNYHLSKLISHRPNRWGTNCPVGVDKTSLTGHILLQFWLSLRKAQPVAQVILKNKASRFAGKSDFSEHLIIEWK